MQHHNSVFHSILKLVPWNAFERAIERHGAKDAARGFTHRSHLVAMLYAQFAGAVSLRDVEEGLTATPTGCIRFMRPRHAGPPWAMPTATARSRYFPTCWGR